jgi:hypothetical protein
MKNEKIDEIIKSLPVEYKLKNLQRIMGELYNEDYFKDNPQNIDIMYLSHALQKNVPLKIENKDMNEYDNWVKNIYQNQSEQDARIGLYQFARENGFDYNSVEKALQVYKYDTEKNAWGELYYTHKAIKSMIQMIANS